MPLLPSLLPTKRQESHCSRLSFASHVDSQGQKYAGVSIETGSIQDAAGELQVLDSLFAKRSAIQLATDAATTILRVDQVRVALFRLFGLI